MNPEDSKAVPVSVTVAVPKQKSVQEKKKNFKDLYVKQRLNKAIEVKLALQNLNINENLCTELSDFSKVLSNWVSTGTYYDGTIIVPHINRKLIYKLDPTASKNTFVKFSKV